MKNLKKLIATLTLTGIIILSTTNAQAGLMMSDLTDGDTPNPCTEKVEKTDTKVDHGIIVNLTGIIVNLTGIIVNFTKDTPTDCGIIVNKG
jgi:hypothetical protein